MITLINHVSFTVSDLDKSVEFYTNVMGLECVSYAERGEVFSSDVTGVQGVKMKIAYMRAENCSIELIQYVCGSGVKLDTSTCNIGSAHVCFNVKDFDKWLEHIAIHKVQLRGKVCVVPAGPNIGKKVCYAMDNDGNNLEFIETDA